VVVQPDIPSAAVQAMRDVAGIRDVSGLTPYTAERMLLAALEHLLPGLFLTVDEHGDSTIWADGGRDPEALLSRTLANARLFDAFALLLPDHSDDEAEED
jgi:hypothetical protein